MNFLGFWLISQVTFLLIIGYAAYEDGVDWTKDNVMACIIMFLFGPLTLLAIFGVLSYEQNCARIRIRCRAIMTEWEGNAKAKSIRNSWDWHTNKEAQEERYNLLREAIRSVTDKNLAYLAKVDDGVYGIEQPLKDAIMDELLERRILNND